MLNIQKQNDSTIDNSGPKIKGVQNKVLEISEDAQRELTSIIENGTQEMTNGDGTLPHAMNDVIELNEDNEAVVLSS